MAQDDAKKALNDAVKKLADILNKNGEANNDQKKEQTSNTSQTAQPKKSG